MPNDLDSTLLEKQQPACLRISGELDLVSAIGCKRQVGIMETSVGGRNWHVQLPKISNVKSGQDPHAPIAAWFTQLGAAFLSDDFAILLVAEYHHLSALGQKQTYAVQHGMSALPPIATAKADARNRSCPLYPRKQTCAAQLGMSALGQKRTLQRLVDHLVSGGEQRRRHSEAKRFCSLEVDHE